jgi:hypothetical protein
MTRAERQSFTRPTTAQLRNRLTDHLDQQCTMRNLDSAGGAESWADGDELLRRTATPR